MKKEVKERVVLPLAIPLGALGVIALLTITFSRILLNVPKLIATSVAAMLAINILVVFGVVAVKEKLTQAQLFMMMVAAVIPLVIGGAVAVGAVEVATGKEPPPSEGPPTVNLTAQSLAFQQTKLEAPAGSDFVLAFENRDTDPHNVAIFKGPDSSAENVFRGDIFPGPKTVSYQVPALEPGSYYFQCDVHPTMTGTLDAAEPAGGPPPGEPGQPEPASALINAKNLTFDKDEFEFPANSPVSLVFDNMEAIPHNVAIFRGGDASGENIFRGELVTGPRKVTYRVPPLEPGRYYLQCDVHPTTMRGNVTVS